MNSLRAKIAILLVVSIVSVVGLATFAALLALGRPEAQRVIEAVTHQVRLLSDPALEADGVPLAAAPPAGAPVEPITSTLRSELARSGPPLDVVVLRASNGGSLIAWVPVGDKGWDSIPLPGLPPENDGMLLAEYLLFVTLGSIVIAVLAANKLTRPLSILRNAVAGVGKDAILAELPENEGPPEVRATAEALNRLSRRLRVAVESRMRLVAAAGHDLRTPMTRMRLRAEFLPDEEERAAWIKDLDELAWLADSAIALVREETEANGAEPIRLDSLVSELAEDLAVIGHRVTLGKTTPVTVRIAPLAFRRAMRNLLINGATHGGGATVDVACKSGRAIITIDDNGPGIPEALLSQVFEPFFRVDPGRRQQVPGAGLGLSIAKEIIGRLGGTLTVHNRPGGGLSQEVALPAVDEGVESSPAKPDVNRWAGEARAALKSASH